MTPLDMFLSLLGALAAAPTIHIPIEGGITEGGLIIVGILAIVIAALIVVGLAILKFGSQLNERMKAVVDQVANDHKKPDGSPLNLRDDLDDKHDQHARKLDEVLAAVLKLQGDVAWLMRGQADQDDRLDELEDTEGRTRRSRRPNTS